MADASSLQNQQDQHRNDIAAWNSEKAAYRAQIERLETAKTTVGNIKTSLQNEQFNFQYKHGGCYSEGYPVQTWAGDNHTWYSAHTWDVLIPALRTNVTETDSILDEICNKITELENKCRERDGWIGWALSRINELGNWIETLLN